MAKFIGTGQCGNKNMINLIEKSIVSADDVLLLNTTLKDIPERFRERAVIFGDGIGGSGKERKYAKEQLIVSLRKDELAILDEFVTPDDDTVYLAASVEGGTGAGSILLLAEYYKETHNMNVNVTLFFGYEDDARGMKNTIDLFKEIDNTITVQCISNRKFLSMANGNKLKANELANDEYAERIKILLGQMMIESDITIDDRDLLKLISRTGYLTAEHGTIDRNLKNKDDFNKILSAIIDNSKSVDVINPGAQRIGVIINAGQNTRNHIDYDFGVIKEKYGNLAEFYTHIQDNGGDTEFIHIIASGMRLPAEEIEVIATKYAGAISNIRRTDSFFDKVNSIDVPDLDDFDANPTPSLPIKNKKNSFLAKYDNQQDPQQKDKTVVVKKTAVDGDGY